MQLTDKMHNDIWPAHEGTATQPTQPTGDLYVQAHKDNDEPAMEGWFVVPGKEAALQNNTAIKNGILTRQDASDDNAHANTRYKDNTPEAMQSDADPEAETTSTVEHKEQCHKIKCPTTTRGQRKWSRIYQDSRTNGNYASSSSTPRNAGRIGAQQRKQVEDRRTHAGIPDKDRITGRWNKGTGATQTLHIPQMCKAIQNADGEDEPPKKLAGMPTSTAEGGIPKSMPVL